jgi:hypothetical protein
MAKTTPAPHTAAAASATAKRRRRKPHRPDFNRTGFHNFDRSVNRRNRDGRTLLHRESALPSANKQPVAIYQLLVRGAVPTMKDKAGQTALHTTHAGGRSSLGGSRGLGGRGNDGHPAKIATSFLVYRHPTPRPWWRATSPTPSPHLRVV